MEKSLSSKKYLCIDVGIKRIGICICINDISICKQPIFRKNRNQASNEITQLLKNNNIDILIVGIPINENNENTLIMQKKIKHFVSLINFEKDIYYQDESSSSQEAREMTQGMMKHKKDGKIDSLSAKIIFDRWYSEQKRKKI
jgi:putative Holliday junction resolvase